MENYGMSKLVFFDFRSIFRWFKKMISDYHWQSIDYQCLPCDLRYNIIVNQETSSSDADFVTELNQVKITIFLIQKIENFAKNFKFSTNFFKAEW